jgi:hypothetical protein
LAELLFLTTNFLEVLRRFLRELTLVDSGYGSPLRQLIGELCRRLPGFLLLAQLLLLLFGRTVTAGKERERKQEVWGT